MNEPSGLNPSHSQHRAAKAGLIGVLALWSIGCYGKNLKFEDIRFFSVSRTRSIAGLAVLKDALHYTAPKRANLYSAVIDGKAPYPDLVIRGGKEPDFSADLWAFAKDGKKSEVTAISRYPKWPDGALFIDGRRMQLRFIDLNKPLEVARGDLIADKIRPAADSRGEAPRAELVAVRRQFVKGVKTRLAQRGIIITGASLYRTDKTTSRYLATTTLPGFPLVTILCTLNSSYYCKIDRACQLPPSVLARVKGQPLVGAGYHPSGRTLVVADRSQVYRLQINSCFDIRLRARLTPPAKIRALTGVTIDAGRKLWLATAGLDDYHAANIYAWDKSDWWPSK